MVEVYFILVSSLFVISKGCFVIDIYWFEMALSDTYEWLDTWEWLRLINSSLKIIGSFSLGGPHRLMG